jgi:hypothetical protein
MHRSKPWLRIDHKINLKHLSQENLTNNYGTVLFTWHSREKLQNTGSVEQWNYQIRLVRRCRPHMQNPWNLRTLQLAVRVPCFHTQRFAASQARLPSFSCRCSWHICRTTTCQRRDERDSWEGDSLAAPVMVWNPNPKITEARDRAGWLGTWNSLAVHVEARPDPITHPASCLRPRNFIS